MKARAILIILIVSIVFCSTVRADESSTAAPEKEKAPSPPKEFVTHHKITVGKEILSYTAVAGEIFLQDRENNPER